MDSQLCRDSTLSNPLTIASSEDNKLDYENAGSKQREDNRGSSDKVTPKNRNHGTSKASGTGRHTRRNNTSPLKSLHIWEAGGSTSNSTVKATAKEKTLFKQRDHIKAEDLLAKIIEGVKKAKEHNDECQRIGQEIMSLESDIKGAGHSTPDQHHRLDSLYRDLMRHSEAEKKAHEDYDIVNNLAMLDALKTSDEPAPRNGAPKQRKGQRPLLESDVVVDSPGPSPSDTRPDLLKRVKGTGQRSSSVASQNRASIPAKDDAETNRGILAEKAGQLTVGTEVFYKFPRGSKEPEGEGIHGIIKKVWQDKKPIQYDVRDPEDDPSGKQNVRKAYAKELVLIPASGAGLQQFSSGSRVYAKYPDTDTFYNAEVRAVQKNTYTLIFEGEEDNKEMLVDRRFVLSTQMK